MVAVALLVCACRTYDTIYTDDAGAACVTPRFPCSGVCVDPTTDRDNCGACGHACKANELCSTSTCVPCPKSDEIACGTSGATFCAEVASDDDNCGTCGNACGHGSLCQSGACVCSLTTCGSDCVDTTSDVSHCGGCNSACSVPGPNEIPICTNSQCSATCVAPWADCDSNPSNGCEANLQSDGSNCGACGRACVGGGTCANGTCPTLVYAHGNQLGALAVDATRVYWADRSATGSILAAPTGGGSAVTVAADNQATVLAVDGSRIVWLHLNDEIDSELLSGGSPTTLATTSAIQAIALSQGTVFYATLPYMFRVPEDGSTGSVTMGVGGSALAVDDANVYFNASGNIDLFSVTTQNGFPQTFAASTTAGVLTLDATHVYWVQGFTVDVVSQPKNGNAATTLAANQTVSSNLATDGTSIYWATPSGNVERLPVGGGTPVAIASGQPFQFVTITVAVDAARVYWSAPTVVASTTK